MGLITGAINKLLGSHIYDMEDEGVDYSDLSYKRRDEVYRESTVDSRNDCRCFIEGCIRKAGQIDKFSWMNRVSDADLDEFIFLYARYYDGDDIDAWFFFEYHYLDFAENPSSVFPHYDEYAAERDKINAILDPMFDKLKEEIKEAHKPKYDPYEPVFEEEEPNYDEEEDDTFSAKELAEYYGHFGNDYYDFLDNM